MIVFNTQEAFEDAVMAVLKERLRIEIKGVYNDYYSRRVDGIDVKLTDRSDDADVSCSSASI